VPRLTTPSRGAARFDLRRARSYRPAAIDKTLAAMDANFVARMANLTAGEDARNSRR
jgi:hypothetical protein